MSDGSASGFWIRQNIMFSHLLKL